VSERGLDVLVVDDEVPALADLARELRSLPETAEVHTAAGGGWPRRSAGCWSRA
jgi:hypothetical protein